MAPGDPAPQRVAVVSGAASGIGLATARRLLACGIRTALLGRSSAVLQVARSLAQEHGEDVLGVVCDVAVEPQVRQALQTVEHAWGRCDILVNNAGIHPKHQGRRLRIEDSSLADWQAVLDTNLTGPFLLTRAVLPLMRRQRWGRIVNVGSSGGRTASAAVSAQYAASKAGLIGLTRSTALETAPDGILVNCVAPGPTLTGMSATLGDALRRTLAAAVPLGRFGTPEEVAAAVAFLVSDEASFLTGAVIDVNGGVHMP